MGQRENAEPRKIDDQIEKLHATIEIQSEKLWQRTTFFITLSFGGAVYCITNPSDILALIFTGFIVWLLFTFALIQYRRQDRALDIMRKLLQKSAPADYWYGRFRTRWKRMKKASKWWDCPSWHMEWVYRILWYILTVLLTAFIFHKIAVSLDTFT